MALDARATMVSSCDGTVESVDANEITIRSSGQPAVLELVPDENLKVFKLKKLLRTNQNTCINQRPIVSLGQKIKKGQIIADGHSTKDGVLALGRNLKVAFMPWRGYNFEDAIIINENLVKHDTLTSTHMKEFEVEIRDTKRGEEELTNEIPNVSEEATRNLDARGIVRIGAEVHPGTSWLEK